MTDREENRLHDAVTAHLRTQGVSFDDDVPGEARFRVDNPEGEFDVRCTSHADDVLVVRAAYPHPIAPVDVERVAELVVRANAMMRLGSLDLDLDTADVSFRSAVDLRGADPTAAVIGAAIGVAVAGMVRWIPPIASVAAGLPVELAVSVIDADA